LLSRRVIDELRRLPEHHRYLRGLRAWVGFRQTGIAIERSERFSGRSKYTLTKLLGLAFDGLFAFSVVPLRVASILGLLTIVFSFVFAAYSIYAKYRFGQSPLGYTTLIVAITFLAGVQLVFLALSASTLAVSTRKAKDALSTLSARSWDALRWTRYTPATIASSTKTTGGGVRGSASFLRL
jgi:hypothetical protein